MSDQILAILILGLAGLSVVPIGILVRWLELRAEHRAARTPAE